MSDVDRHHQHSVELEDWLGRERVLRWRRAVLAILVVVLIVGLNLYFWNTDLQRRVDFLFLRAQTALKRLEPHDRYVPTPALPTPEVETVSIPSEPTPTPTPEVETVFIPSEPTPTPTPTVTPDPTPIPNATPLPASVQLESSDHEPQGWNNCGPATLSMALRFYDWTGDQYTVAAATKPDKNDKNVSPEEMVAYVYSLGDMFAVMGYATDLQLLKLLLSNGFPVIVETWFIPEPEDEMGHYRLLTGYDDATGQFMTHDSYNGPGRPISYAEMDALWKVFNRVYVVVSEADQGRQLTELLGDKTETETMYGNALSVALAEVAVDAEDRYGWFNVGTNYLGLGRHEEAANAYDRARMLNLPWRTLWYQFGPFEAYLSVGRYQDVIDLANANLKVADNLEESYYYRALARRALGDEASAQRDLQKALQYNPYFGRATEALSE